MTVLDWIRVIGSIICLCAGIFIMIAAVIGNYHFKVPLNRMHAAAMGDSLGILLVMLGVMILADSWMDAGKAFLVAVFFWVTSPVCSHLVAMLETSTNEELEEECEVEEP